MIYYIIDTVNIKDNVSVTDIPTWIFTNYNFNNINF